MRGVSARRPTVRGASSALVTALLLLGSAQQCDVAAAAPTTRTTVTSAETRATETAPTTPTPSVPGVSMVLTSLTPRLPEPDPSTQKVVFSATVRNDTDVNYRDLQLQVLRGDPITRQDLLSQAITDPPPLDTLNRQLQVLETKLTLPAHSSVAVTYTTNPGSDGGMCLCFTGVYPFALTVSAATSDGGPFTEIADTQVLVPAFTAKPAGVQVGWVWPLIDRPHRSLSDSVFTDDQLAESVSAGGRLERALQAAQLAAAGGVRLTLLVDPDLLDSLAVMAAPSGYKYRSGTSEVTGTGGPAAASWLSAFAALRPSVDVSLTAYADPDIDAVTRAGLRYSTALDPQVQTRLQPYVNGDFTSDVYWPADGVITAPALDHAVASGAASVILSDRGFAAPDSSQVTPNALTELPSASGQANGLVTDSAIEGTVADALKTPAHDPADEQTLLAQLAIRPAQDPANPHFVVITPQRYVDADPGVASELMKASVSAGWTTSVRLADAIHTVSAIPRGSPGVPAGLAQREISGAGLATLASLASEVNSLRQVFTPADATTLLGGFNNAALRAESNGWRLDPTGATSVLAEVQAQATALISGIHLVQPTNGTYSLSSQDSPVVVTVENDLAQNVTVHIAVQPALGVLGFRADPATKFLVPAHSKSTISIPTHVQRLGKFKVVAELSTPDGRLLGQSVPLTLRVTAIGGITKAITGIAGLILVLALIVRFVRRFRDPGRRKGSAPGTPMRPAPPRPAI